MTKNELIAKWEKELKKINKKHNQLPDYDTIAIYYNGEINAIENFLKDLKQLEEKEINNEKS